MSDCDPSTFYKKGEVYQILKILFINSSKNDFIDIIIPVLAGTSNYPSCINYLFLLYFIVCYYPVILPDLSKDKVKQDQWIQNWCRIFIIASSYWNNFINAFIESACTFLITASISDEPREWYMIFLSKLFTKWFYTIATQKKDNTEGNCSIEEIHSLGYFPEVYIHILLKSMDLTILDFLEKLLGNCII